MHTLCLSRKENESIVLIHDGEAMTFRITAIDGDKVRLQFVAPLSYRIVRAELVEKEKA